APFSGREEAAFRRAQGSRTFGRHRHASLTARSAATTCRGDGYIAAMQNLQLFRATFSLEHLAVIYGNALYYIWYQTGSSKQQLEGKAKDQCDDQEGAKRHFDHGWATCANVAKPSDIMPVRMKAIPRPCSPSGISA